MNSALEEPHLIHDTNKKGRTLAGFVYAIYLLGLPALLPWLIGVGMAYFSRSRAAPIWVNHAVYQIRSFWLLLVNLGFVFATMKFTEWRAESASMLELAILG